MINFILIMHGLLWAGLLVTFSAFRPLEAAVPLSASTTGQASPSAKDAPWIDLAKRFSAESSDVHNQSIQKLRALPDLNRQLRAILQAATDGTSLLSTPTFLAFDVISTLKLGELLPDLLQFSETDRSGFSYHAINALITPDNRRQIIERYRARLANSATSPAARMALLDTLGRLQTSVDSQVVEQLAQDPAEGTRSALVNYLRSFLLRGEESGSLKIIRRMAEEGSLPLQIQVIYLLSELTPQTRLSQMNWVRDLCGRSSAGLESVCTERLGSWAKK